MSQSDTPQEVYEVLLNAATFKREHDSFKMSSRRIQRGDNILWKRSYYQPKNSFTE